MANNLRESNTEQSSCKQRIFYSPRLVSVLLVVFSFVFYITGTLYLRSLEIKEVKNIKPEKKSVPKIEIDLPDLKLVNFYD